MVVLDHLLFFMRTSLITLALLVIAPHATAQTTHTVSLTYTSGQGAFTPNELTVELGDTVRWDWLSGFHSVDSFHGLFSSGAPLVGPFTYSVVFDQAFLNAAQASGLAGTSFDYFCTPHLLSGMVGNITVALPGQPLLEISQFEEGNSATIAVSRATSGGVVGIAYSLAGQGPTSLLAGPCGLVSVDLAAPIEVLATLPTNPSGTVAMSALVPVGTQGFTVYFQALDLGSCTLSNSGAWRIR
jgi:plastocyanin